MTPSAAFAYLCRVLYNRRCKMDPLWNSLAVAGVDAASGRPFLGTVGMLGTSYEDGHVATGFGNQLARPLMRARHSPEMSEEAARELLRDCLRVLYYRDKQTMNKFQARGGWGWLGGGVVGVGCFGGFVDLSLFRVFVGLVSLIAASVLFLNQRPDPTPLHPTTPQTDRQGDRRGRGDLGALCARHEVGLRGVRGPLAVRGRDVVESGGARCAAAAAAVLVLWRSAGRPLSRRSRAPVSSAADCAARRARVCASSAL